MDALNEMTALNASVGAEAGQPFTKSNTTIINNNDSDFNRFDILLLSSVYFLNSKM